MDYLYFQELYHHGIKGQKWGIRKYQNEDGSLTEEGKARYGYDESTGKLSKEGKKVEKSDIKSAVEEAKQFRKETRKKYNILTKAAIFNDGVYGSITRGKEYGLISEKYGKKVANSLNRQDIVKGSAIAASIIVATDVIAYEIFKQH